MFQMMGVFAACERSIIRKRVRAGLRGQGARASALAARARDASLHATIRFEAGPDGIDRAPYLVVNLFELGLRA